MGTKIIVDPDASVLAIAPEADFSAWPTVGPIPLSVAFTNGSGGDYTGNLWTFGDGVTSTLTSPSHTYATAGVYTVSLTVTGPDGSDTLTRASYVTATPRADFMAEPTLGDAPLTVAFTDASEGAITGRWWGFGDGAHATAQNPSHEYTSPGTYTVTLTVTDTLGLSHTATRPGYVAAQEPITTGTWVQTNWIGGEGQLDWSDTTQYRTSDSYIDAATLGQLSLLPVVGDVRVHGTDTASDDNSLPAIASDGSGNSCVAWKRSQGWGTNSALYLQRLDHDANRLWAQDVQVTAAVTETISVAADGSGYCYVVWEDGRSGNEDVYAQKYDSSGSALWTSGGVRVNDYATATQNHPDVTVAPNASWVLVTWEDTRTSPSHVYAQKLSTGAGTRQWANDRQTDGGSFAYHMTPKITVDAAEACYYVTWRDSSHIYAHKRAVSTNSCSEWASQVTVWQGTSQQYPSRPDLALGVDGNLYVAWLDRRVTGGKYNLYVQKFDSSGNRQWNDDVKANGPVGISSSVWVGTSIIGSDADGNFYVAWQDDRVQAYLYQGFIQKFDSDGARVWVSDVRAAVDPTTQHNEDYQSIAVDPDGSSYVVWLDRRENYANNIYGQKYDTDAQAQWRKQVISGALQSSLFERDYVANWGTIDWTSSEPSGTSVQVEVSANEGLTWTLATKGESVDLYSPSLIYRVTLTSTVRPTLPVLYDLSVQYTPDTAEPTPTPAPTMGDEELEAVRLINQERTERGLAPLLLNESLFRGARQYSQSMATDDPDDFTHYLSPSGEERCVENGFNCWPAGCYIEEVIAGGYWTAADVVDGWMESAGHHEALLNPDSREIGIGHVSGGYWGDYWTGELAAQPNTIPIFIDNDAEATTSRAVTVTLDNEFARPSSAAGDVMGLATQVQVSLSPTFSGAEWITYPLVSDVIEEEGFDPIEYYVPLTVPVTLPPEPGTKSVYARFRDAQGRMTVSRDTIRYAPEPVVPVTVPVLPPSTAYFQSPLFVGAATFDYPIEAAPGTAGLQPNLVLRYSSYVADQGWDQQSGWTGLGASLDLGYIVRRPDATPADTSDDSFILYLDGTSYPLVYSDPTLGGDGYYHTERETFWRIQRLSGAPHGVDGGEYWVLTTQDGTQRRFGYDSDSAWRYVADGAGTRHVYRYNLDRMEDPHTNTLTASYITDTASYDGADYERAGYLSQILYTGNATTGAPARRRVDFSYSSREISGQKDYDPTWRFRLSDKLDAVEVRVQDEQ